MTSIRRRKGRLPRWASMWLGIAVFALAVAGCEATPQPGGTPGTPMPTPQSLTPGSTGTPGGSVPTPFPVTSTPPAFGTPETPSSPPAESAAVIEVGSVEVAPGETAELEITARNMPPPGLAGFTVDLVFDPAVMQVRSMGEPREPWVDVTANVSNPEGRVRLVGGGAEGVEGTSVLGVLIVEAVGASGTRSEVQVVINRLADSDLQTMAASAQHGQFRVR